MVFPATRRDITAEIFVNGDWVDISTDVYHRDSVTIEHGRPDEGTEWQPSSCSLTVNNSTGKYTLRNPLGDYIDSLGINTPLRVAFRETYSTFGTPVVDDWGDTDTGVPWDVFGVGGVVAFADWQVAGGVGTHSVPAVTSYRTSYLPSLPFGDVEVVTTVSLAITNITGGPIEPANIWFRGATAADGYLVRLQIETDESITLDLVEPDTGFSYLQSGAILVTGVTHTSAQSLRIRAQIEGQTIRAKVWVVGAVEPYDWLLEWNEYTNAFPGTGWVAIRSGISTANSNAKPIVFSYDNVVVKRLRYTGELTALPSRRDTTASDKYVPLKAGGITCRLGTNTISSAPRTFIPLDPAEFPPSRVMYYWPLEDGPLSVVGIPVVGTDPFHIVTGTASAEATYGQGAMAPWLGRCAKLIGGMTLGAYTTRGLPGFTAATGWMYDHIRLDETDGDTQARVAFVGGSLQVTFKGATNEIEVVHSGGTTTVSYPLAFDNGMHHVRIAASGAATVTWIVYIDNEVATTAAYAGALGAITSVNVSNLTTGTQGLNVGHVCVYNNTFTSSAFEAVDAAFGFRGETAGRRLQRLCLENDIPFSYMGELDETAAMGPQGVKTLLDLFVECERTDMGSLSESRGVVGVTYHTLKSFYVLTSTVTLNYANKELTPPFLPVDDNQLFTNSVTAQHPEGGEALVELTTGRMSVLPVPQGGRGRKSSTYRANSAVQTALQGIAEWQVHLGTVDESRFPDITVNLANARIVANTALAASLLDLNVDERIVINNAVTASIYDPINQIVRGITETFAQDTHQLVLNCQPANPFAVVELDSTAWRLDSSSTVLDRAVTSVATSLYVRSSSEIWTTAAGDLPLDIKISGERMTVSAITSATPTLVATGTAAHQNNASCAPGLPTGHALDDMLIIFAAIRNSGTGVPIAPAGWATLITYGNMALFGKQDNGAESTPTVTFTGGAANVTCSAQMAAFRYASLTIPNVATVSLNGSAQDIILAAKPNTERGNSLILQCAWKQDDWTSVAALTGSTEIGDTSSTLGDDQGIVWDFRVQTEASVDIPATSFVVTGGGAAISRSFTVPFWAVQKMTVTRAVNGVAKAHTTGKTVSLADPSIIGY